MNKIQKLILKTFVLVTITTPIAIRPSIGQTLPSVQVSPTPTPTPVPVSTPAVQTVFELTAKIRSRLLRPEVRRGQVGIKIVSLASGRTVFEENAEKYFMPASNMKNFTVAAAIERLTPDYRFVTSIYAPSPVGPDGVIRGDVRIYGRGDVSISTAFSEGNYYKGLDDLADKIVRAGVKRIEGSLIGDDSYFTGDALPGSWEWDDLQWYYGAEVSSLPLNDNAVDLSVKPGPIGYACSVKLLPLNLIYRVTNLCTTTAAGTLRTLRISKKLNQNILEITGSLPAGNPGFTGSVTITRPAELFASLLKERLTLKGVIVTGTAHLVSHAWPPGAAQFEIARLESAPLSVIAAKTMKPSQNMYTETLLRTLGEQLRAELDPAAGGTLETVSPRKDSAELGIAAVRKFLTQIGVAPDAVVQYDGSGLSRHNLITPSAVAALYMYMGKQSKYVHVWRNALTIAGVDGTLRNRFTGTRAAGNFRGKTGTIDQVSALSGYLTTAAGQQLVVSTIVNGVPETRNRTGLIDEVVLYLVNFDGKIE